MSDRLWARLRFKVLQTPLGGGVTSSQSRFCQFSLPVNPPRGGSAGPASHSKSWEKNPYFFFYAPQAPIFEK